MTTNQWPEIQRIASSDANVLKYVFKKETAVAEAVLYKYPTYEERTSPLNVPEFKCL